MAYVKCLMNVVSSTIPDGKTVTPTDDISIWLACGERSETYTTLSQVLADSTCLSALINSNNAVDYLVRSTTWASDITADSGAMTAIGGNNYAANTLLDDSTWCSAIIKSTYRESVMNLKNPLMTSATTPSGVVSASSTYPGGVEGSPYQAFDYNTSTRWTSGTSDSTPWIQYQFASPTKIKGFRYKPIENSIASAGQYKIQGSSDGNTWEDLYSGETPDTSSSVVDVFEALNNDTAYSIYRFQALTKRHSYIVIMELTFYGRADV